MGTIWQQPSPSDFDRLEQFLAQGVEPKTAADQVGHTLSAFKRTDPERHGELLRMSREARGYTVDRLVDQHVIQHDDQGVPIAYRTDASDSMIQFHARRWNPAYGGQLEVNHSGAVGVTVEYDFAAIIGKLEAVGLLQRGPAAALDPPGVELLPARPD